MKTIAFTGHRPKDLPRGFDYQEFAQIMDSVIASRSGTDPLEFVTGGALGIDTWAAEYATQHNIPFHIITPFTHQVMTRYWKPEDAATLQRHIELATRAEALEDFYRVDLYQRRNEAMVDRADCVLAFWTGKRHGGTWNAIQYALKVGKPVVNAIDGRMRTIKEV